MKTGRNYIWGAVFILAAVLMLFNKLDIFSGFSSWKLVASLLLVLWLADGVRKKEWGNILFPIAFLCIVFRDLPGFDKITPWPVIGAAILGSLGMNMITGSKKGDFKNSADYIEYKESAYGDGPRQATDSEGGQDNTFMFSTSFSSGVKYVSADDFVKANINCSFGEVKVYFDDAFIRCEEAVINLNVKFGSVQLYFPKDWYVENHAVAVFGGIEEKNRSITTGNPKVRLVGDVAFGDVSVTYC